MTVDTKYLLHYYIPYSYVFNVSTNNEYPKYNQDANVLNILY